MLFARTRAERERNGDPRPSVEERYSSRADTMARVENVATRRVQDGYLIQEDVQTVVEVAGEHWDWTMPARMNRDTN